MTCSVCPEHTSFSGTKTHCLSGRHIVFPEDTLSLRKTVSLRKTHCLFGRNIVSLEDALSLQQSHCFFGRHIVSPENTFFLHLNNDCRSSLACHSLGRSPLPTTTHGASQTIAKTIQIPKTGNGLILVPTRRVGRCAL